MTDSDKTEKPQLELLSLETGDVGEFPRPFGNYMLLSPLGQGGMGDVYLAKHSGIAGIEKHCVLKTLRPQFTDDREYVHRFIDEARVVVQLSHKNICSVFDVGIVDNRYYLAMEYIAGNDLKTLVMNTTRSGEKLELGTVLHVVGEVLEALDYAHRHIDPTTGEALRLVHRDVSPQNVMISFEGEVKLIDFGLAASTLKLERTEPNVVMGKVAYMAPEQVRGEAADGRVDIFAVGVMLYELLTNERFYEGKTPYEIWSIAGAGSFRPKKWNEIDAELRAVLSLALATNRDERYKTCAEMRESLEVYRVHHALRGSTFALREVVERTMTEEISDSRMRLAKFKNVKMLRTSQPTTSPTKSIPTAGAAAPAGVSGAFSNATTVPTEGTETIAVAKAAFGRRSSRLPLIGGAVAVVAAVAIAFVVGTHEGAPSTTETPVATTPTPTTTTTTPVTATTTPTTPVTAPTTPTTPTTPVSATTVPTTPGATTPGATTTTTPTTTAPVEPTAPATGTKRTKTQTKSTPSKPKVPSTGVGAVDAFNEKCPSAPCAQTLTKLAPKFAAKMDEKTKDEAFWKEWKAATEACRKTCK